MRDEELAVVGSSKHGGSLSYQKARVTKLAGGGPTELEEQGAMADKSNTFATASNPPISYEEVEVDNSAHDGGCSGGSGSSHSQSGPEGQHDLDDFDESLDGFKAQKPKEQASKAVNDFHLRTYMEGKAAHKTYGKGLLCGIYALAKCLADLEGYTCVRRRAVAEHRIFQELNASVSSTQQELKQQYVEKWAGAVPGISAEQSKENALKTVEDMELVTEDFFGVEQLYELLKAYFRDHGMDSGFELTVLRITSITTAKDDSVTVLTTPSAAKPQNIDLRNVNNYHWEAYARKIDNAQVSVDGRSAEETDFAKWADPVLNGGVIRCSHVCSVPGSTATCSEDAERQAFETTGASEISAKPIFEGVPFKPAEALSTVPGGDAPDALLEAIQVLKSYCVDDSLRLQHPAGDPRVILLPSEDLETLKSNDDLDSQVLNAVLQTYLVAPFALHDAPDQQRVQFLDVLGFNTVIHRAEDIQTQSHLAEMHLLPDEAADQLAVPVFQQSPPHWIAVRIVKAGSIEVMDSLEDSDRTKIDGYITEYLRLITRLGVQGWDQALQAQPEWIVTPLQSDSHSCGLRAVENILDRVQGHSLSAIGSEDRVRRTWARRLIKVAQGNQAIWGSRSVSTSLNEDKQDAVGLVQTILRAEQEADDLLQNYAPVSADTPETTTAETSGCVPS